MSNVLGELKIVVLQRGWVLIGRLEQGEVYKLHNAQVIRRWGTTGGLGQLASDGVQANTLLDPANGVVEFHPLTMVFSIAAVEASWPGL